MNNILNMAVNEYAKKLGSSVSFIDFRGFKWKHIGVLF